jgi:hypothetical protein
MVGWYSTTNALDPLMPIEMFPWSIYSHIVYGKPWIDQNTGIATCNSQDANFSRVLNETQKHGRKLIWKSGLKDVWQVMTNASLARWKHNFVASIGEAVRNCSVDGLEFDYECPNTPLGHAGIVTPEQATIFTQFMADVKQSMGPGKQMSCDMGVWGVTGGSYPLMMEPWVNVSMVKAGGAVDYINAMSYHFPQDPTDVLPWVKDGYILSKVWGIPKNMINIGLPYYYRNGPRSEVVWAHLAARCPNLDPDSNECAGIRIVSKRANHEVGKWIATEGYRGAFPWAASYDTLKYNNTLSTWVYAGLQYGEKEKASKSV